MSQPLPLLYLARHGETAWSLTGQHTGRTDLPLTQSGMRDAKKLGARLHGLSPNLVLTSPLQRARRTCEIAGFGAAAQLEPDLLEWNYGDYEGRRSLEIYAQRPGWDLFRDGCPGGELPGDVAARADRVIGRIRASEGSTLLFSSGHFLRMLAIRWIDLPAPAGSKLFLDTASFSILGYGRQRSEVMLRLWNDTSHLAVE